MEEAQRLLTVSVWKLYRCRVRRGGLRLHRSLQLSLLVRAARHRYLSARAAAGSPPAPGLPGAAGAIPAPAVNGAIPAPGLPGAAAGSGAIPVPELSGAAGAIPVPGLPGSAAERGAIPAPAVNGAIPVPELPGTAERGMIPGPELPGAAGAIPVPELPGAIPVPELPGAAVTGATPGVGGGPSADPRCPNPPSADRATPRTEQEWGNPLRDCAGDHRNPPGGAPRSEWHRGCPPGPPSEDPPSRNRDPAPTADPVNRDPPPAAPGAPRPPGAPRAGQKRRSSGSAGPARGPVPSKRARLEAEAPPLPPGPPGRCSGPPAAAFGFLLRAVGAC